MVKISIKKLVGKLLLIFITVFLFSCKERVEYRNDMEFILETFIKFYDINEKSNILIQSAFSNENNTYDLLIFDLGDIEPPYNYLGIKTLKATYKTYTVFYSSSSSSNIISNQLEWEVYKIKKSKDEKNLYEYYSFYDFKELRFLFKINNDSLKVTPPEGISFSVMFPPAR